MPKSRSSKLTPKKTGKTRKGARIPLGREKNAPTQEEWDQMPEYGTFQVSDLDGNPYDFSVNETARILPNGCRVGTDIDLHQYWICKILAIRASTENNVWVQIQWFYSPQDTADAVPTFNAAHCGKFERIESNHRDCVSSSVFDGRVSVKHYDERALDPAPIPDDGYFYRYTLNVTDNSISPTPTATCSCGTPYSPSDADPTTLMHFCPRPSCRRYYHSRCITTKGAPPAADADRDRGFLLCDPDTGRCLELDDVLGSASDPPKKKRRTSRAATPHPMPTVGPAASTLFAALPPALLDAAAQPIVRGGAFAAGGVAGNVSAVLAARRLVFDALSGGASADGWEAHMPDRWEALVAVSVSEGGSKNTKSKQNSPSKAKAKAGEVLALQCPECGGPI
ncbi:hypothetical protein DFH07DRAFT_1007990 [Mycena maculata]|uniref:BAH domain-containing protein n=1 Tax=Mycena maculata TaxID=230809 RepID=A0AAD7JSP7_9AGAR|nr:hypothetical protein DFH07DRAFT_1007990 [Mycena maculata]